MKAIYTTIFLDCQSTNYTPNQRILTFFQSGTYSSKCSLKETVDRIFEQLHAQFTTVPFKVLS